MNYDPNEPRDESGKWASFDAGDAIRSAASDNKLPLINEEVYNLSKLRKKIFDKSFSLENKNGLNEISGKLNKIGIELAAKEEKLKEISHAIENLKNGNGFIINSLSNKEKQQYINRLNEQGLEIIKSTDKIKLKAKSILKDEK